MEEGSLSCPRLPLENESNAAECPSSSKPGKLRTAQLLQAALTAVSGTDPCCSTLAVPREKKDSLDIIQDYLRSRSKQEAQKLRFLASVCTIFSRTSEDPTIWHLLYFFQLEVVGTIKMLLQEEPTDHLGGMVRQQAMLAITSMSRAGLLLRERRSSLLHVCFSSVFLLPPQDTQGPEASLYSKVCHETLAAMDSMLQVLVCSTGALNIVDLQNILQLLLPFTNSQSAAAQERAVARIARLVNFITTYPMPQACTCFAKATVPRNKSTKTHHFGMLGMLVGHLTLCCTSEDEGTCLEAAEALHHLHTFVLQQTSTWPWLQDMGQLQLEACKVRQLWEHSKTTRTSKIFLMFLKYLQSSDQTDVILVAINSLGAPSTYSMGMAAYMLEVLVADSVFQPKQVLKIVWAIYINLPSITAAVALNSLEEVLVVLMHKHLSDVVVSLLQCSPTCTNVAMAMWKQMLSEPLAAKKVLQELLNILMNQSLRKPCVCARNSPCILSLAAAKTISEILPQPTFLWKMEVFFPKLFLALLIQVSFVTELLPQEVHSFQTEHQQDLLTPIRSAVQSMGLLLYRMGLETQVLAIKMHGGWDALLSPQSYLMGVRIIAREIMETPRALRSTIIHHLTEILSVEDPKWEMIAMVFLIEMLDCTDLSEELECALDIFPTYLQSQCRGMPSLVLEGILTLMERPGMARKTLTLLPYILEQLQHADRDVSTMALFVVSNMLPLLESNTLSLTTPVLADKVLPLFHHESDTVRKLSICIFQNLIGLTMGTKTKKMKKKVWDCLLALFFHLHDQNRSVAVVSQKALCSAARFLKWKELERLAESAQAWKISECLLARKKSRAKDYLCQIQVYLQSPQESLQLEAVRFIGLIGRQVHDNKQREYISKILQDTAEDTNPLISSLATQTILILEKTRPSFRLRLRVLRPWTRKHSSPSKDSACLGGDKASVPALGCSAGSTNSSS